MNFNPIIKKNEIFERYNSICRIYLRISESIDQIENSPDSADSQLPETFQENSNSLLSIFHLVCIYQSINNFFNFCLSDSFEQIGNTLGSTASSSLGTFQEDSNGLS